MKKMRDVLANDEGARQAKIVIDGWNPKGPESRQVAKALVGFVRDNGEYSRDELATLLNTTVKALQAIRNPKELQAAAWQVWGAAFVRQGADVLKDGLAWEATSMTPEFNARFKIEDGIVRPDSVADVQRALLVYADELAAQRGGKESLVAKLNATGPRRLHKHMKRGVVASSTRQ